MLRRPKHSTIEIVAPKEEEQQPGISEKTRRSHKQLRQVLGHSPGRKSYSV